jgi:hypothetical protein
MLEVYVQDPPDVWLTLETTADVDGNFVFDHPSLAFVQFPVGELTHFDERGNQTRLGFSLFRWILTLGFPCVEGRGGLENAQVELSLEAQGGLYQEQITTVVAPFNGYFSGCFQRALQAGDRLRYDDGLQVREFTVPPLTARLKIADQVLVGTAPPHGWVEVGLALKDYQQAYRQVQANAAGRFGLDLSGLVLDTMATGYLRYEDPARNVVYLDFPQASLAYLPWVPKNP